MTDRGRAEASTTRLSTQVVAPLVLGGPLWLGRPYGARARTFSTFATLEPADEHEAKLRAQVDAARLCIARRLAPLEHLAPLGGDEWTLAAVLHDLLQMLHPRFATYAARLASASSTTLAVIPPAATVAAAIRRHTVFSRVLAPVRTDTTVDHWAGRQTFVGVEAPARALAWPNVRRVQVATEERLLFELAAALPSAGHDLFTATLARFLQATPLTDLATAGRKRPIFEWSAASLGLVANPVGHRLAARAIAHSGEPQGARRASVALGEATRRLAENSAPHARTMLAHALGFLGTLALDRASAAPDPEPWASMREPSTDFARAVGATVASATLQAERAWYPETAFARLSQHLHREMQASAEAVTWTTSRLAIAEGRPA